MFRKILIATLVFFVAGEKSFIQANDKMNDVVTLAQCYQLALKRSYILADNEDLVHQAQARISQARSAFLPSISFNATHLRQDVSRSAGLSTSTSKSTDTYFNVSQSLFKGFKDFALLRQRKLEHASYQEALHEAKIQLYDDVADAFFTILQHQKDIANIQDELNAYAKRKSELVDLKSKARARESDIVVVEVSIADLEAQQASAKGLLLVAYEVLHFLTGLDEDVVLADVNRDLSTPGDLTDWTKDLEKNPAIIRSTYNLKAAQQQLTVARSGYWPSANLDGNRYTSRDGMNKDIDWDVLLSVKVPIFSGGNTRAEVKEFSSRVDQLNNALEMIRQEKLRDIQSMYKSVLSGIEEFNKLQEAWKLSQLYYDLLLKDNRQGIATNIDVLNALADTYRKKRAVDQAFLTSLYDRVKLEVIAAKIDLVE